MLSSSAFDFGLRTQASPLTVLAMVLSLLWLLFTKEQSLFLQEKEVNGIKFWCYHAGHVLGAAMFMIEIAGVKVIMTIIVIFNSSYQPLSTALT